MQRRRNKYIRDKSEIILVEVGDDSIQAIGDKVETYNAFDILESDEPADKGEEEGEVLNPEKQKEVQQGITNEDIQKYSNGNRGTLGKHDADRERKHNIDRNVMHNNDKDEASSEDAQSQGDTVDEATKNDRVKVQGSQMEIEEQEVRSQKHNWEHDQKEVIENIMHLEQIEEHNSNSL
ncbi:hypothetical protein K7X08_005153 [Anisodus acutangulus]|uniref:Uncharacterized protein n=1 Tax=Anisodus acutangulus TaxID=402998 RepID=A0A9Q1RII7_9SOLA|nr:hypothetical protein K7X08_005153 [Anisodus acutangulus]